VLIAPLLHVKINYYILLHIITIEKTQYSSQDVKNNAMINLVQGVAHMHLKQAEGRDMPECIKEQVKS